MNEINQLSFSFSLCLSLLISLFVYLFICLIHVRLTDSEDDIRAVAADILLPLCHSLLESEPIDQTILSHFVSIINILWNSLIDSDELTVSIASIMNLLGTSQLKTLFNLFDIFLSYRSID